jgi:hypothetical protein
MSKSKDPVNYVLTGSRYQVVNDKGETVPEYGVGMFRSGIRLQLAMDLYARMMTEKPMPDKVLARQIAANAFILSEAFLDEMDKDFHRAYPDGKAVTNNNTGRK